MPSSVIQCWIPVIAWLLAYEAWAVIHVKGYTLSEAVWWCVGLVTVGSRWPYEGKKKKRIVPKSVKLALLVGWLPAFVFLLLYELLVSSVRNGWDWLLFLSPYPWRFICDYSIGVLTGHFLWQRITTYELIDKDEWNEWATDRRAKLERLDKSPPS
jgi:hypothetical protein